MPDIEDQIRRAQEQVQFDNLPGKGKPLHLDDNPHVDPEWRLAHHMLHSAGYSLPWIEMWREIEADLTKARSALRNAWSWRTAALADGQPRNSVQAEWGRAEEQFRTQVEQLNRRITDYNLSVPSQRFQRRMVNAAREIEALTSAATSDTSLREQAD